MTERMEDVEGVVRGTARPPEFNWWQSVLMTLMLGVVLAAFVSLMLGLIWTVSWLGYGWAL